MDPLLIEEIATMLREELRMLHVEMCDAFSKLMCMAEHVPVRPPHIVLTPEVVVDDESMFLPPSIPAPEIQADDDVKLFTAVGSDLIGNTFDVFNKESFPDLIVNTTSESDLADGIIFNTNMLKVVESGRGGGVNRLKDRGGQPEGG
jgi:hypothetical protein